MSTKNTSPDIIRVMLSGLFLSVLMVGTFWVLSPFLSALVWATMIVIPTWPVMLWIKSRVGGRRSIAVMLMSLVLCVLVFVPVWLAIKTIVENTETITGWAQAVAHFKIPHPPSWVAQLPLVGGKVAVNWEQFAQAEHDDVVARVAPYLVRIIKWFPAQLGNAGMIFVHFLLTMIIAIILYFQGEIAAKGVLAFARRLAGDRGEQITLLAAQAIKAVAMGIVVTAIVQALVAGIGLAIAGIPYALLLTALIFVLSVIQIGSVPVLLPTVSWLFWSGDPVWGSVLLVWSIFVLSIDNFLRPYLIKRGADLPILLIFTGVMGGLISFGILGLFIGPVILAVSYTLIRAWMRDASA